MENYNQPCLDALSLYDDGRDLSDYNFNRDGFKHMHDDADRRKLAYRQRVIAQKYAQVVIADNFTPVGVLVL